MTSPTVPPPPPDDDRDALAGEHVLGLLPPEEAAWVERARRDDPQLDAAIRRWQERLLALDGATSPVAPDPALWRRIEASLWAPAPSAAPIPAPPRPGLAARLHTTLWSSLRCWRGVGLAAAAAAVALAVVTTVRPPPTPVAVTVLVARDDQAPGWIVETFADGRTRLLPLTRIDIPADRTMQLWTLRDPAEGPISLGLVPRDVRPFAPEPPGAVAAGQLFEITLEPATGSPTGRPTGPILFIGRAAVPPGR
jgi:anti-sigma-K factor RskA